ncbi:MAG: NAD-dependent epimerase/dehydratase family protein [candidate division NC10 bacterium]|nr:NAD-dependent epimerase/dehydratase family protein [candidate division NC10 bacterium]
MTALVTGGTGFVGAHLVRALLDQGESVRCLVRPGSDRRNLAGLPVEVVEGDITEPFAAARAVRGCDTVFHAAALYQLWVPDPAPMYRVNVGGTRTVLAAAGEAGAKRIVYTSTVGALGNPGDGRPGTETTPVTLADMVGHYKRSKFLAEQEALRLARAGLPVVIVNPSAPVGAYDVKPTPTGQMMVDFLRGRMRGVLRTGLNLVAASDVAAGHLLAAERGKAGERYILGHANLMLEEIFTLLARLTGIPAPRLRVPYGVAYVAGVAAEVLSRLTGRPPRIPLTGVRMARKVMFFDAGKAVRELGLPQTPVEAALREAVDWFTAHGYAGR